MMCKNPFIDVVVCAILLCLFMLIYMFVEIDYMDTSNYTLSYNSTVVV